MDAGDNNLILKAYHLQFKSSWKIREYIIGILKNHFIDSDNVHSIICAIRTFKNQGNQTGKNSDPARFLQVDFYNKYESSWSNNNEEKEFYKGYKIDDHALMGSYYKRTLDNESFLIITSEHNKIYETIESRIQGCHFIDMESIKLYKGDKQENKDVGRFSDFEINYLFYKYNKAGNEIEAKKTKWTSLVFPFFFLSEFVGMVNVVFEGELDINSIEDFVKFLRNAKNIFYRGIIDSITDEWIVNNPGRNFIDCLHYFFPLKEIDGNNTKYYDPFIDDKSNGNDIAIFIPSIHEKSSTYMPLLVRNDSNNKYYYLNISIEYSDTEMRLFAFNVISHIQWLWQRWEAKNCINNKKGDMH